MTRNAWDPLLATLAVVAAFAAAAQTDQTPAQDSQMQTPAPSPAAAAEIDGTDAFEATEPPPWTAEEYPAPARTTAEETDPAALRKTREVAAEMDRPAGVDAEAAAEPDAPPERSFARSTMKGISALCIVLAIILLLGYVLKRMGKHTPLFAGTNLARVLGKVYLAPRASIHFVRTGDKVLVVGVTQNAVSLVAQFDADAFPLDAQEQADKARGETNSPEGFLTQLRAYAQGALKEKAGSAGTSDSDIAALRMDIQRLQHYLEDNSRGTRGK